MRLAWVSALASLAAVPLLAASKPDFSGVWVLNVEKSEWGPNYTPPKSRTDTIEHKNPDLWIRVQESTARGDIEATVRYSTDGKEATNIVAGNPLKAVLQWEGRTLFLHTWGNFGGNEIVVDDRWTLSSDGKALTVRRTFKSPTRTAQQTIVYEKKR